MTPVTVAGSSLVFLCDVTHGTGGQSPKARTARRCREVLSRQLGLITRDQTLSLGLTERQIEGLLSTGKWVALFPAVYADAASTSSWRRSVLAAVFHGGPHAVASGRCAAALLSLPGFRPAKIEITTPRQLKGAPFGTRRGLIPPEQITRIGPIPLTDASRTLLDIAGSVPDKVLEDSVDDALRRSITSLPRLKWLLHSLDGKGKKGSATLRRLVHERSDGQPIPESVFETRLWRPLCRLGVPRPIRQHPVADGKYRIDFAFPHAMVAVEAQSYTWHSSRSAWERDIDKCNTLTTLGWTVVYVTWSDLREGLDATIERLRDLLLPRFL